MANEVANELDKTSFGIICITREKYKLCMILFEAGALAKSMQNGRVVPLLLDIEFKDISGPLSQFQAKKVDSAGLKDVIDSINACSEQKLPEGRLTTQFNALWPALQTKTAEIRLLPILPKTHRPQAEVLEELVSSVRGLDQRFREVNEEPVRYLSRRRRFHPMMIEEMSHRLEMSPRDPLRLIILASFLKEDFPWIYEVAAEVYRAANSREGRRANISIRRMYEALSIIRKGPMQDIMGEKESYYVFRELQRCVEAMMAISEERNTASDSHTPNQKTT